MHLKMNKQQEYRIDFQSKTITLNKKFAKAAAVLNSKEYRVVKKLRTDYPDYAIELKEITKKEGKKSYAKLTYDVMRNYIRKVESETTDNLRNLNTLIEAYKGSGCYPKVKKWFLDKYPDYTDANATMDKISA